MGAVNKGDIDVVRSFLDGLLPAANNDTAEATTTITPTTTLGSDAAAANPTAADALPQPAASALTSSNGWSALHAAAMAGHTSIVELLLERKAFADVGGVNVVDDDGATPLFAAVMGGRVETAVALVAANADVNKVNEDDRTALHLAANADSGETSVALVRMLLAAGAKVNVADYDGFTPLHTAVRNGHTAEDAPTFDPLADDYKAFISPEKGSFAVAMLLGAGADPLAKDESGRTPLYWAESCGYKNLAAILREAESVANASKK